MAPFIVLKAKKFVILFTLGSLFSLGRYSLHHLVSAHQQHVVMLVLVSVVVGVCGAIRAIAVMDQVSGTLSLVVL